MRTTSLMGLAIICSLAPAPRGLAAQSDPRARIFIERKCSDCHAISGLKIKAKTDVGPDLTYADVDVSTRYSVSLERFFEQPEGVMRLVLGSSHVRITKMDADSIATILRRLYIERLAQRVNRSRSPL